MRPRLGTAWVCALGAALAPASAHASAWAPPAKGQSIWTSVDGTRLNEAFSDTEIYLEQPITARFSAVLAPRLEIGRALVIDDPSMSGRSWNGEVVFGAKALLRQGPHTALSVQASALGVRDPDQPCARVGEEARLLAGVSEGKVFGEAEGAYRQRAGGCRGEKLDLTLGWRPWKHWLGLGQAFLDRERAGGVAVTTQMSVVKFDKHGSGLQIGVRFRVDAQGQGERALVVGWWDKERAKR